MPQHIHRDLYRVLGVSQDAKGPVIERRYRKLAREHHPDHGGDAEQFKSVHLAYEVLSDPERRDHYDRTGEVGSRVTGDENAPAMAIIASVLQSVIQATLQVGSSPTQHNILELARTSIRQQMDAIHLRLQEIRSKRWQLEQTAQRFTVTGGRENFLAAMARAPITECDFAIQAATAHIGHAETALGLLSHFEYRHDDPRKAGWPQGDFTLQRNTA